MKGFIIKRLFTSNMKIRVELLSTIPFKTGKTNLDGNISKVILTVAFLKGKYTFDLWNRMIVLPLYKFGKKTQ